MNASAILGEKGVADMDGMRSFHRFKSFEDRCKHPFNEGRSIIRAARRYDISCRAAGEKSKLKTYSMYVESAASIIIGS